MVSALPASAPPAIVCVGKEWYRFPSSFFLPEEKFALSFLHDASTRAPTTTTWCLGMVLTDCLCLQGPASQLPQPYSRERGTAVAPPNMNDQNREEPSRYVAPETCDYLVELLLDDGNTPEHKLDPLDENIWEVLSSSPYLDVAQSALPWRAFHVPGFSDKKNVFAQYVIAKKKSPK